MIVLHPADGPAGQAAAVGDELVRIHDGLRRQLAAARAGVRSGAVELREHCLAFCGALHGHHTNEDGAFPQIEKRFPELAPVLDRLRREHVVVAGDIRVLRELLEADGDVGADLDRLAQQLETHFAYEEELLIPALNKL